jgi:hypothetical protein
MTINKLNAEINITPNVIAERQGKVTLKWDIIRKFAVRHYLQCLARKEPKIQSLQNIARMLFPDRKAIHTGRLISYWTQYVIHYGVLPAHSQGKFVKRNR